MGQRDKRIYALVERFMWKDPEVRSLPKDAKLLWCYLLTNPHTRMCPGLVEASLFTIMDDTGLGEEGDLKYQESERIGRGLEHTRQMLELLMAQQRKDGTPWVKLDEERRLIIIPGAIEKNMPHNINVARGWARALLEIPDCEAKIFWVRSACHILNRALGREDSRARVMSTVYKSLVASQAEKHETPNSGATNEEPSENIEEDETVSPSTTHKADKKGGATGKHGDSQTPNSGATNEEPSENIEEDETVSPSTSNKPGNGSGINTQYSVSSNNTQNNIPIDTNVSKRKNTPSSNNKQGTGKASTPADGDGKKSKSAKDKKPDTPPSDFSDREKQVWDALRKAVFYVPGTGEMTGFDAVKDPVALSRMLGGPAYPAVDVNLIYRLANWTMGNRNRGKKRVQAFLINRFSVSQERSGAARAGRESFSPSGARGGEDLEEKMKRKDQKWQ